MAMMPPKSDLAQRVTDELLGYIDSDRDLVEPEGQPLLDELAALVGAGGKRLRPLFCIWGYKASGGADEPAAIRTGAAIELLHTMALIQDDVMDASTMRRNRASTFVSLAELSAGVEHRGDPQRFGASAAILAGMLGFVLADRLFWRAGHPEDATSRAAHRYDALKARAIAGQYLDLLASHRGTADEETALRIATLKAGSYSVADPLAIGSLLASDDPDAVRALEEYGRPLGVAFQLRDDILSTFGDPDTTGKDCDGDIREGKQTVLLAKARKLSNVRERRVLKRIVGCAAATPADAELVREIFVSSGALLETEKLIDELTQTAVAALEAAPLARKAADALSGLANAATKRIA